MKDEKLKQKLIDGLKPLIETRTVNDEGFRELFNRFSHEETETTMMLVFIHYLLKKRDLGTTALIVTPERIFTLTKSKGGIGLIEMVRAHMTVE